MEGYLKNSINKIVVLITVLLLSGLIYGCSRNSSEDMRNYVFSLEAVEPYDSMESFSDFKLSRTKDEVVLYGTERAEDGNLARFVHFMNSGEVSLDYSFMLGEATLDKICILEDGTAFALLWTDTGLKSTDSDITSPPMDAPDMEGEGYKARTVDNGFHFQLIRLSRDGDIIVEKNLNEDPLLQDVDDINMEYGVRNLVADGEYIFVLGEKKIVAFDYNLNYVSDILVKQASSDLKYAEYIRLADGLLYAQYSDSQYNVTLARVNLLDGTHDKGEKIPGAKYFASVAPGLSKDFLICNNGILCEFDFGDTELTKRMDFTASGVPADNVYWAAGFDENHFISIYRSINDSRLHLGEFTKVAPEDVVEKTILNLAIMGEDNSLRKSVINFNQNNPEYSIRILDYQAMYGLDYDGAETALNKLNTDIISGNMPDMLIVSPNVPLNTYISKNLLEDLYPYIDADPMMQRSDFDEYILELYSKDDKLYTLVPNYTVSTLCAKQSLVGDRFSWTVGEALRIKKQNDVISILPYADQESMIHYCISMNGKNFVDVEKAECYFDSAGFKQVLKFIKDFIPPNDVDYSYWDKLLGDYSTQIKRNAVLCVNSTLSDLSFFASNRDEFFDKDIALIGFPVSGGEPGSTLNPGCVVSMSAKSKSKDACWQFLRQYLMDDYQMNPEVVDWSFPIKKSAYEYKLNRVKDAKNMGVTYTDFEGNEIYYPLTYYVDGEEIPVSPFTDEEIDRIDRLIHSIKNTGMIDSKIVNIILEESKEFFNDNASVDEVCKRIQSRVQIYIYECQ